MNLENIHKEMEEIEKKIDDKFLLLSKSKNKESFKQQLSDFSKSFKDYMDELKGFMDVFIDILKKSKDENKYLLQAHLTLISSEMEKYANILGNYSLEIIKLIQEKIGEKQDKEINDKIKEITNIQDDFFNLKTNINNKLDEINKELGIN